MKFCVFMNMTNAKKSFLIAIRICKSKTKNKTKQPQKNFKLAFIIILFKIEDNKALIVHIKEDC